MAEGHPSYVCILDVSVRKKDLLYKNLPTSGRTWVRAWEHNSKFSLSSRSFQPYGVTELRARQSGPSAVSVQRRVSWKKWRLLLGRTL